MIAFLVAVSCASASTIQVIKTKQVDGAAGSGTVRFSMPAGWRLHSVRTNDFERTIVPIGASPEAAIHVYPFRDSQHRHTESDVAQQYLVSDLAHDQASKVQHWGSVKTSRYGVVALTLYRTPHSRAAGRVFAVLVHGSTYVRIEFLAPAMAGIAKYGSTLRELIRDLRVSDI